MFKNLAKIILTAKAAVDVVKEKVDIKAAELLVQVRSFTKKSDNPAPGNNGKAKCSVKEKLKEELLQLISEINHKSQINELQLKGYIKDKLTELTNNALLDSMELNDIRAEIASLHAEITDIKSQMNLTKTK